MDLNDIKQVPISRKKAKRIGRGIGSGQGKTSGKGHKGQNARSGTSRSRAFEGGTMPLYRRLPKRGFNNERFSDKYVIVNVEELNALSDGQTVTLADLDKAGIVKASKDVKYVKILGNGELKVQKLKVKVHKISKSAKEKIENNQGTVKLVPLTSANTNKKK
ncbi:50S ribosomal protein L15 [Candidatus Uabimicrobium sp. HlEnr_7]|uniref:50S ribosomal protein L15 n=1 Tax=Candidatus Uabimicrobium helgolandensis TaxID=3095367 RepID=UPI003558B75F